MKDPSAIVARLRECYPAAVVDSHARLGDQTVVSTRAGLVDLLRFCRDDENLGFDMLADLTAVDYVHGHFMASGSHRHNILSSDYRLLGVSVSYRWGYWHFVQLFAG